MFADALTSLEDGLSSSRQFLRANVASRLLTRFELPAAPSLLEEGAQELRESAPDSTAWKILDHCAAIGRSYALFEQFCARILSDWLEAIDRGSGLNELPEGIGSAYQAGMAKMLELISQDRFDHLSLHELIQNYGWALEGRKDYRLFPEVLTYHERNLRFEELSDLFLRCGISGISAWFDSNKNIAAYFGDRKGLRNQTESRLTSIIQYRNDAAHGLIEVDEILGYDELIDVMDFFLTIGRCLHELVVDRWVGFLSDRDGLARSGKVTEKYRNNVAIVTCEHVSFRVGDPIVLRHRSGCQVVSIESIQLNDVDQQEVVVANPCEVGLRLSSDPVLRSDVYIVPQPKP